MRTDYKRELEKTAHQMILVHDVNILTKLILRTIVTNIKVRHAGIFFYNRLRDEYVVTVSRGQRGFRIPPGFAKISLQNPMIRYFLEKDKRIENDGFLIYEKMISRLRKIPSKKNVRFRSFYENLKFQMSLYKARACVAGFFRDKLIGVLFLGKKNNNKQFTSHELGFLSVLASDVVMAIQNAWLFEDLKTQLERNKTLFINIVRALAQAIEAKDRYTSGHTERVTFYSLVLLDEVRRIKKASFKQWQNLTEQLKIASLLHDIGKIGVSERVLNKKSSLTNDERNQIEMHPMLGFEIIKPIEEFKEVLAAVKYHHERYDGSGYPEGLRGKKIPLLAAIIAVADAYDAMTTHRPYRKALSHQQALCEVVNNSGKQFHPLVVRAFRRAFKKGIL